MKAPTRIANAFGSVDWTGVGRDDLSAFTDRAAQHALARAAPPEGRRGAICPDLGRRAIQHMRTRGKENIRLEKSARRLARLADLATHDVVVALGCGR